MRLGFWQLHRAGEKESLLAAFDAAEHAAPMALAEARRVPDLGSVVPHVLVRGTFREGRAYLLDNQIHDGRRGVFAYAVFVPEDGSEAVLVNRGFIARNEAGALPDLPPLPQGGQQLHGLYAPPPGIGMRMGGNALPAQAQWPKLTIYLDTDEIGADLGERIDQRVILLDADPASGFVRDWMPQVMPPQKHRGYALQWFSFALAAVVIFFVLHWRRPQPDSP